MCEFCENATKWNTDDYDKVPNRSLSEGIMTAEDGTYQIGTFSSQHDYWNVLTIKFCPMCGRELCHSEHTE